MKSRKEQRKENRLEKKKNRNEFFKNRGKSLPSTPSVISSVKPIDRPVQKKQKTTPIVSEREKATKLSKTDPDLYEQLVKDNLIENVTCDLSSGALDKDELEARRYAKKLGLKKTDKIGSVFKKDGLDYILSLCAMEESKAGTENDDESNTEEEMEALDTFESEAESEGNEEDLESGDNESLADENDCSEEDELEDSVNDCSEFDSSSDEFQSEDDADISENDEKIQKKETTPKYVPVHLRKLQSSEPEDYLRLRKLIQGHLNRMAESNIESIFGNIEEIYRSNPRHDVSELLIERIILVLTTQSNLLENMIMTYACLISLIFNIIGSDIGASFVQKLVELFLQSYKTTTDVPQADINLEIQFKCANLLALLCHVYNFKIVSSVILFDMFKLFISKLSENDVENVLRLIRMTGSHLRTEDPVAFKDVITKLQEKAVTISVQNIRFEFMLEQVYHLKNNKGNINKKAVGSSDYSDVMDRLKKITRNIFKKKSISESEPLRCSLDDILSIETKGKWWVVGAAWVGRQHGDDTLLPLTSSATSMENSQLLQLARKLNINTEIRRNIFVVLVGSEDYLDAFEKLGKLSLKDKQEREIVKMIVFCCGREKRYNPYYAHLGHQLCAFNHGHKITFQFTLWDILKQLANEEDDEFSTRKVMNLAFLYAQLIEQNAISISVLKALDFGATIKGTLGSRVSKLALLVQFMLTHLLLCPNVSQSNVEERLKAIFQKLKSAENIQNLKDGLDVLLTHLIRKRLNLEIEDLAQGILSMYNTKSKPLIPADLHKLVQTRIHVVKKALKSIASTSLDF